MASFFLFDPTWNVDRHFSASCLSMWVVRLRS